jgi:hypothetical protein
MYEDFFTSLLHFLGTVSKASEKWIFKDLLFQFDDKGGGLRRSLNGRMGHQGFARSGALPRRE